MTLVSGVHPERTPQSRWRRRALTCLFATGAALPPRAACAEDLVDLRWTSLPGCPPAAAVQDRIRTIVSHSRVVSRVRAEGEISQISGKYRLTLLVFDGHARRERIIESDSCEALAGAAAVTLGLLLRGDTSTSDSTFSSGGSDDAASAEQSPTSASSEATSSAPSAAPKPARASDNALPKRTEPAPERTSSSETQLRLVLRAPIGAVDAGPLPDAALNAGGGVGLRYGAWHLGTSVRFFASETASVSSPPDVGATVERIALDVWGCHTWTTGRFELGPCLTVGLDRFSARGTGSRVEARSQSFLAIAPGAGLQSHLRVADWFALFVSGAAGIQTSRARLTIGGGVGDVERLGSTRITAAFGTEWIF